jgi:hypothetical protein
MLIEFHDHLTKPLTIKVSRVLVMTDDGTPIAFSVDFAPGHMRSFHVGDKDFELRLQEAGFNRTVIINKPDLDKDGRK